MDRTAMNAISLCTLSAASLAAPADDAIDIDERSVLHRLVQRVSFGATPSELALAQQLGFEGYLERQLNPSSIDDSALEAMLAPLATLGMAPGAIFAQEAATPGFADRVRDEARVASVIRAVFGRRLLLERMAEFWTDHFYVPCLDDQFLRMLAPLHYRDALRANALGQFPALLAASASSPAMLRYLNADVSTVGAINENFAREALELHTLGLGGGYTHDDIVALARCMTGWSWWGPGYTGGEYGTFRFRPNAHDMQPKAFLGVSMPANRGIEDGQQALALMAAHPSTPRFIALKMARRFLGDDPPRHAVAAAETAFRQSGGDTRAVLRSLLTPANLYEAPAKVKRPMHVVASALRALGAAVSDWSAVLARLDEMGHTPYAWPAPNGYPDDSRHWSGLLAPRWNTASDLANNRVPGVASDIAGLLGGAANGGDIAGRLDAALCGGRMQPAQRAALAQFVDAHQGDPSSRADAVGLALASPAFLTH